MLIIKILIMKSWEADIIGYYSKKNILKIINKRVKEILSFEIKCCGLKPFLFPQINIYSELLTITKATRRFSFLDIQLLQVVGIEGALRQCCHGALLLTIWHFPLENFQKPLGFCRAQVQICWCTPTTLADKETRYREVNQ